MKIKQQHIIQLKIITILLYIQSKSPPLQNQVGTASPSAQGKLTLFDPLTNNILNNDIEATLQLIYRVKNRDTGTIVADRRPFIDSRGYLSSSVSPWSEDRGNYETIAECTLDLGKYTHYVGEFGCLEQ